MFRRPNPLRTYKAVRRIAFIPVVILLAVLCARWILVIGYGDFGVDYDFASRVMAGQWQGRDFFAIFPPISGFSLAFFLKILGDQYITVNIHLWFWWLVNVYVAARVMLAYGGSTDNAVLVAAAVALLTVPPASGGKPDVFMASSLSGLAVLLLLGHFRTKKNYRASLAGAIGGLCIFVKPNVGVAIIVSMLAVCFAMAIAQRQERHTLLKGSLLVLLGSVIGAAATLAVPGFYGGFAEVTREIFAGGSEIKGGFFVLVLRTFPRISMGWDTSFRYIIEAGLALPLLGALLVLFGYVLRTDSQGRKDVNINPGGAGRVLWFLCGLTVVLSVWSLLPVKFSWDLTQFVYNAGVVSLPFFLWQLYYFVIASGLLMSVLIGIRRREFLTNITSPFWASFMALIWTLGLVASGRHNTFFASTLFMPALALRFGGRREKIFYRALVVFVAIWMLAWHVAPNWRSTFAQLEPLPADSRFSGLYWPDNAASTPGSYPDWSSSKVIWELHKDLSPRVQGKSVLWLVPGPGAAFGGEVYSYGVHALSFNNVPPWAEKRFGDAVQANLPEYVVSSPSLAVWNDPRWTFMRPDVLQPWLRAHYKLVWTMEDVEIPLSLWQRKEAQ